MALVIAVLGSVSGLCALWFAADGKGIDATPQQLLIPSEIGEGTEVWLRGMRDRQHPVTLSDGRVLYPVVRTPQVMVECGAGQCAGVLAGRVEDLRVAGVLPTGWPEGAGRQIRVVRVGRWGSARRVKVSVAAALTAIFLLLGLSLWRFRASTNRGQSWILATPSWPMSIAGAISSSAALLGAAGLVWRIRASAPHSARLDQMLSDPALLFSDTGMQVKLIVGTISLGMVAGVVLMVIGFVVPVMRRAAGDPPSRVRER